MAGASNDESGCSAHIDDIFSGSQTMAYVMALQQEWPTENLKFQGQLYPREN